MTEKTSCFQLLNLYYYATIYFAISFLPPRVIAETNFPQLPSDPVQILNMPSGTPITDLAFSHDCAYLLIATGYQISLWEEANVSQNDIDNPLPPDSINNSKWSISWSTQDNNEDFITAVVASPDSAAVAYGTYNGQVQILDQQSGIIERTLVAFEPSTDEKETDFEDGEDDFSTTSPRGEWVTALAFCPDQPILLAIATLNGNIFLWNIITGKLVYALRGHTDNVTALDFSQNGEQLVSGSWDGTVRFWDLTNGQLEKTLLASQEKIGSISLAGNLLIASGVGQSILSWDLSKVSPTNNQFSSRGGNLSFGPNEAFFLCQTSDKIYVWSMEGKIFRRFGATRRLGLSDLYCSFSLRFSQQDDLFYVATGTTNGQVLIWDMRQVVEPAAFE